MKRNNNEIQSFRDHLKHLIEIQDNSNNKQQQVKN